MKKALLEAKKSKELDEVPVGAIIVKDDKIIARAHNTKNETKNAINHAEIIALNKTMKKIGDWHLNDYTMFVTLEPCPMCAGALINCRVGTVVIGAKDKKAGCFSSVFDFSKDFNHKPKIVFGILEQECGEILTNYFKEKRNKKNGN